MRMLNTVFKGRVPDEFINVPLFGIDAESLKAGIKVHCLNNEGLRIVSTILRTISKTKSLQYCPILPHITSLLVIFLEEREVYKVLDFLIEDSITLHVKNQ